MKQRKINSTFCHFNETIIKNLSTFFLFDHLSNAIRLIICPILRMYETIGSKSIPQNFEMSTKTKNEIANFSIPKLRRNIYYYCLSNGTKMFMLFCFCKQSESTSNGCASNTVHWNNEQMVLVLSVVA